MTSAQKARTTYVLLAGLPGTGKSTLATQLAARLHGSVVLNKDAVRAVLFPGEATDYSDAQNDLCMQAMLASAAYLAGLAMPPRSIFFDGRTFSRAAHIGQVVDSAEASLAGWRILYLWCADEVALSRLQQAGADHPAGNRNASLYFSLKGSFEPIRQPHLALDTGQPIGQAINAGLAYLDQDASS